jgi:HlyD family secretion protein
MVHRQGNLWFVLAKAPQNNINSECTVMDRVIEEDTKSRKLYLYIGVAAVVALMAYFLTQSAGQSSINIGKDKFHFSTIKKDSFAESVPIRAELQPIKTIYLDSLEGGQVDIRHVEEGEMVKKGQKIATLVNNQVQLDMISREAQITEQLNNLYVSKLALEQNRLNIKTQLITAGYQVEDLTLRLHNRAAVLKRGLLSQEEFALLENELKFQQKMYAVLIERQNQNENLRAKQVAQLEESLVHLQKNLKFARRNVESLVMRAPSDGLLTQLNAEIGEFIAAGQRVGQIDIINAYKATALVDEFYINRVRVGQIAAYKVNDKSYQLKLTKIYPAVTGGQFEIDFSFIQEQPSMTRGQTFQASLLLSELTEVLVLERGGFYQDTGGKWAFVVTANKSRAVKRPITLGRRNRQYFEVIDGLQVGEQVITSSYGELISLDVIQFE